jgi:PD-(D/E)XK nuclease superfamily
VALYADCGRAWMGAYIDHLPRTRSGALVLGSAFDAVLERTLRARAESETAPPISPAVLEARWRAAWREELTGHPTRDGTPHRERAPEPVDWEGELPKDFEAEGRALATAGQTATTLTGLRVAVETGPDGRRRAALQRRIDLRVPGVPVPVIGFVDAILEDGTPVDFKTARRPWRKDKPFKELQPRLYLLALREEGYPLRRSYLGKWVFSHYVWSRRPSIQVTIHTTAFTDDDLELAAETVRSAWKGIVAGAFVPNTSTWRCDYGCAVRASGQCLGEAEAAQEKERAP